jgi:hypothetical protein
MRRAMAPHRALVLALVASAHASEHAQVEAGSEGTGKIDETTSIKEMEAQVEKTKAVLEERRKQERSASIPLPQLPDGTTSRTHSAAEVRCSACEAVARELMVHMHTDSGGSDERIETALASTCDDVDRYLPEELPAKEEGGPPMLHFWPKKRPAADSASVGLGSFCSAMVREYESELRDVMAKAEAERSGKDYAKHKHDLCEPRGHTHTVCT